MKRWQSWFLGIGAICAGITSSACSNVGSFSKAPITPLATGGTQSEREQQFLLRRLKWEHRGKAGKITGLKFFTDTFRPIAGAREQDTLYVHAGPFQGSYTIKKIHRLVDRDKQGKRRRQVVVEISSQFFDPSLPQHWKTLHQGSGGLTLTNNVFTDGGSFLPEVPLGTQLVIRSGGTERNFTIIQNRADTFGLPGLQRVGYVVQEPLPKDLRNLTYQVRTASPTTAEGLSYHIHWAGSGLAGHNFTLGINRRRYAQREVLDLLNSTTTSKQELQPVGAKRGTAIVFQVTGAVAVVIGGFLALVRRDDFPGASQAIPWSIAGGGAALLLASIPLNISANNDFLRSAKSYNKDLLRRLAINPPAGVAMNSEPHNTSSPTVPPSASTSDTSKTQR